MRYGEVESRKKDRKGHKFDVKYQYTPRVWLKVLTLHKFHVKYQYTPRKCTYPFIKL